MSINLEIRIGRPWQGLSGAYARGEDAALRWFPGDWRDAAAWRERARLVGERFDRDARARAVAMLRAPDDAVRDALTRVVEEGGFLVTTGQQPGLFTGPLYAVHKALSAIALARWLETVLDAPVVPVFWVASEDHDWDEVDHADLIGVDNELHRIQLAPPPGAGERPLHRLPVQDLEAAVAALSELLPDTDFTPGYLELIRRGWKDGATLPEGIRDTLEGLLGPLGMAFVDAGDGALKTASAPVLAAAARRAEADETALAQRAAELETAGWHVQVPVLEGGVNLFFEDEAGRERLYRRDGDFRLRHSGTVLSMEDLERRLADAPGTVSPNVLLRPVIEAATLPTVGYVAGPGETAYLAQVAPLFAGHGVTQPLVFPRFSVTLIEAKVGKVLEKFSLQPEALDRPLHEIVGEIAREEMPDGVRRGLGELRGAVARATTDLLDAARPIDPTLKGPIQHARGATMEAWDEAERKIVQAVKRENEVAIQQVEKARLHLFPGGVPQERLSNPFYFLARYGPELLKALIERFAAALPDPTAAGSMAPSPGPR